MEGNMKFENEYEFLSNFSPCIIDVLMIKFPTVEHAFQASKTSWESERIMISQLPTPGQAKRAGRKIHLRSDWEKIKIDVMYKLLQQKFSQPLFRDLLLKTGDIEIVEDNNWNDQFWGMCNGRGQNQLGKILMKIRNEIQ
jgi:ribA/ribD-fused uncharacterized protein